MPLTMPCTKWWKCLCIKKNDILIFLSSYTCVLSLICIPLHPHTIFVHIDILGKCLLFMDDPRGGFQDDTIILCKPCYHMGVNCDFKESGPIASDFFLTFGDFGIRRKVIFFSLPLVNFTAEKCTVWMILMKMWLVMVTIKAYTIRYRQLQNT